MKRKESLKLGFLSSEIEYNKKIQGFWKLGVKDDEESETVWVEGFVKNPREGFLEPDYFPEEVKLTLNQFLLNQFSRKEKEYKAEINSILLDIQHKPNEFHNLIEFFKEDLFELQKAYQNAEYFKNRIEVKLFVVNRLEVLILLLDDIDIPKFDSDLEKDKIKFNLSKKEVCLLFNYLSKHNIIAGLNSNEELAALIEKHCMYESKNKYFHITNAKNTLSKNKHDDSHKSLSPKLQKILKGYS